MKGTNNARTKGESAWKDLIDLARTAIRSAGSSVVTENQMRWDEALRGNSILLSNGEPYWCFEWRDCNMAAARGKNWHDGVEAMDPMSL